MAERRACRKTAGEARATCEERPLRPSQCREYMRKTLAREFRGIVEGFVKEARRGSCQHVKLATELVTAPGTRRRGKGPLEQILEEMEKNPELYWAKGHRAN